MPDILHIGIHKTGSTYLQNAIWPQVEGVQYLSRPFTQHNHAFNQLQYADDSLYDEKAMRDVLIAFGARPFLISDEALSGKPMLFASINRSHIARRLRVLFPDATVIVFIRNQHDVILSHYSSYVKEPVGTKTLRDFVWKPGMDYRYEAGVREHEYYDPARLYYNTGDFHLHLDSFLYARLIGLYRELFERVEVFLYEDLRRRPSAVVDRLSAIVGQRLHASGDRWNRSFSRNELAIRRTLNRARPLLGSDGVVKGLSRLLGAALPPGSKEAWRDQVRFVVGDYYKEDNRTLRETCPDLPWDLYEGTYV
jgi:hypothetical protein